MELRETIQISKEEAELFGHIKNTCESFGDRTVVARVAGGWVRDKLIGYDSDDYDITLEGCSGSEFSKAFIEYLESIGISEHSCIENPSQSKHLSTCKVCISGKIWVDFCGLRSEKYHDDSRIPEISVGTPFQDAQRRDFTINTLFYNICTQEVEDYFNGKEDLKNGILKTPIDTFVSFKEDPLRILRCLRFGARFDLKYDDTIFPAIKNASEAFIHKVTPERAAIDIQKALEGPNPLRYIREIIDVGFFDIVFDRHNEISLDHEETYKRLSFAIPKLGQTLRLASILAAIYAPEYGKGYVDSKKYGKRVDHIERDITRVLRMPSKITDESRALLAAAHSLQGITEVSQLKIGHAIREGGEYWMISACLLFNEEKYKFIVDEVIPYAKEHNLCEVWAMKPIMNGNQLSELHNIKGSQLKVIQSELIDWQLLHLDSTVDDYIEYVKSKKESTA